ncbi:BQ2448_205 [Microbotryum intermedium]|uniref:BQ2448_205 protein n=1 Tax=Microbotryum intermedium TaxID=269621 RepID=A0A238F888_9BASI|nr:BQ2448_205 [Microbotryum intermedium]
MTTHIATIQANSRGTLGGKLATQLAAQKADGNRAAEARQAGETRDAPLVWD